MTVSHGVYSEVNIDPHERNAKAIEDAIRNELATQIPELSGLKLANAGFPDL